MGRTIRALAQPGGAAAARRRGTSGRHRSRSRPSRPRFSCGSRAHRSRSRARAASAARGGDHAALREIRTAAHSCPACRANFATADDALGGVRDLGCAPRAATLGRPTKIDGNTRAIRRAWAPTDAWAQAPCSSCGTLQRSQSVATAVALAHVARGVLLGPSRPRLERPCAPRRGEGLRVRPRATSNSPSLEAQLPRALARALSRRHGRHSGRPLHRDPLGRRRAPRLRPERYERRVPYHFEGAPDVVVALDADFPRARARGGLRYARDLASRGAAAPGGGARARMMPPVREREPAVTLAAHGRPTTASRFPVAAIERGLAQLRRRAARAPGAPIRSAARGRPPNLRAMRRARPHRPRRVAAASPAAHARVHALNDAWSPPAPRST
jgi:hypothetical protein